MTGRIFATVTQKGKITLPIEIRRAWKLKPGDQVVFDPPDAESSKIAPRHNHSIFDHLDELKLPSLGRPFVQDDIEESIAQAMREREERSRGS